MLSLVSVLAIPVTVKAYTVDQPDILDHLCPPISHRLQWEGDGGYVPLDFEKSFNFPVRDTNVTYVDERVEKGGDSLP